jgi:hypothetical protein
MLWWIGIGAAGVVLGVGVPCLVLKWLDSLPE